MFGRKYWINKYGQIECPGDDCRHKCTDKCPIWLRTQAAMLIQFGETNKGIALYKQALAIEPTYRECWNNLGASYGVIQRYDLAKDAYMHAYNIQPNINSIYGLALVSKDLNQYDECLKYIAMYEKICDDGKLDRIKELATLLGVKSKASLAQLDSLLDVGYKNDWLASNKLKIIPFIYLRKGNVIKDILKDTQNYYKNANMTFNTTNYLLWCAYAGFGITHVWFKDKKLDDSKNLLTYVTDERGIDCLDEVVFDMVGVKVSAEYVTKEYREFESHFKTPLTEVAKSLDFSKAEDVAMTADNMFIYGMSYAIDYNS